jgi:hypothetical protein
MTIDTSLEDEARSRPRLSRRAWWAIGAGMAVLIALSAWWALYIADQDVRWRDVGYEVVSPLEVTVTYDVFLYSDKAVTCHLRALNSHYAEVGVASQRVDPSAGKAQRFTTTLTTTEAANTAVVNYCEADS